MEQALIDALKTLPGAALVGIPLVMAVRALWARITALQDTLVKTLTDGITSDAKTQALLDKIADRLPKA